MNRRQARRSTKKKHSKGLKAIVTVVLVLLIGLVVWVGINDWDVEKALERAGLSTPETESPIVTLPEKENTEVVKKTKPKNTPNPSEDTETSPTDEPTTPSDSEKPFDGGYVEGQKLPTKPTYFNEILLANKKYPLPTTFAPGENKDARAAFEEMSAEAKLSNFNLTAFSTYRSYDYQVTLYNRYADRDGAEAADRYSARPGYSEHQTGLAFDIGEVNHEKHWASSSFGETEAGKWLLANAHRYGFILRYPKNKEEVTGYMHEAWHYRYVGKPISEEIFKKNITLEEYLGVK
ncbi:M15 family metallopeptidase [Sporosarcina sp. A2]|uniref:M15 family metallopeptidase n=1 Tax=Sporosarcina sp. A2 TaxID=3393449 RepID=UPI003D79271A